MPGTQAKTPCAVPACDNKRVAQYCQRRMCRQHCIRNGGCTGAKGHVMSDILACSIVPEDAELEIADDPGELKH